ncbi:MAG: molybdenum cofactor biosynthesis protein MoaE [Pseudomonadota bacterium]
MHIKVQEEDFSLEELALDYTAESGGHAMFLGTVRARSQDKTLMAMTIEHYPGMTETALENIAQQACGGWDLEDCLILHRYGRLRPGDKIVLVITRSQHRHDAFEACRFIADWLKTEAPFWKCEEFCDGTQHWVTPKTQDIVFKERWSARQNG